MPSCFGSNAQGCQSGINRILIYIPASQKCRLTCHPVCMQLPMNASRAFFGFIMYYPLLDGHVGFWQSLSFIHFGYNLLSELRKYVFLCRLAVKCNVLNKILYIFIHFLESYTILSFFGGHLGFGSHFESFYSHNGTLY